MKQISFLSRDDLLQLKESVLSSGTELEYYASRSSKRPINSARRQYFVLLCPSRKR